MDFVNATIWGLSLIGTTDAVGHVINEKYFLRTSTSDISDGRNVRIEYHRAACNVCPVSPPDHNFRPPLGFPVAAGDLVCSNDAGLARGQTAVIRSLAISAGKIRILSQRNKSCKLGQETLDGIGHSHIFFLWTAN